MSKKKRWALFVMDQIPGENMEAMATVCFVEHWFLIEQLLKCI